MPSPITDNTLFFGDNLTVLREHIADESVDLIYLDPPFNSSRNYNLLFKDTGGRHSDAQITAFEDTWSWNATAEATYQDLVTLGPAHVSSLVGSLRQLLGTSPMMAYLVMMTVRLVELHRVLRSTGSLYLHCDPTASHYLKIVLDAIFGPEHFQNEVIWKRSHAHNSAHRWGPIHDTILFYSKTDVFCWSDVRQPYEQAYTDKFFKFDDADGRGRYWTGDITASGVRNGETGRPWRGFDPTPKGRHWAYPPSVLDTLDADHRVYWPKTPGAWPKLKRYLNEAKGVPLQDVIADISSLSTMGGDKHERLGYPTQKPLALLERIIQASSDPGDIVLDPFCGCGTAIDAAQRLGRRWIGIDVTHLAIAVMKHRLSTTFPGITYTVRGEPVDVASAYQLAQEDRYQFQWWAASLIHARPIGGQANSKRGKKGADGGIDGIIPFSDTLNGLVKQALVQVKSGKVSRRDIAELVGTVQRERAALGVFITLEPPTKEMQVEAAAAGHYYSPGWQRTYPTIQILTIAELLAGKTVKMPPPMLSKAAPRATEGTQHTLDLAELG